MKKSFAFAASLLISLMTYASEYNVEKHHVGNYQNPGASTLSENERGVCNDHGQAMSLNNEEVVQWKTSKPNNFLARAYVQGTVDAVFADLTGHHHFSLKIGPGANDRVEIIYQLNFGNMPEPRIGDEATACGDFINAYQNNGGYPPSPDGAIVHWVHRSDTPKHDNGFVVLNGITYGE